MKKLVGSFATLLLMTIIALGVFIWKKPLSIFYWMNRRAVIKAGFNSKEIRSAAGVQRVFEGGNGPTTLVLLHGAGDQAGTWAKVAPELVGKYHVLILDLAGHGESEPHSGQLSIASMMQGLDSVFAEKTPGHAILVGNSLGAWVAMLYARQHPERVDRLVLVNGGAISGERQDLTLTPETREQARLLFDHVLDPGSMHPPDYVLDDFVRRAQSGPLRRMFANVDDLKGYLLDGKLQEIQPPVDLLWGESDRLVPIEYAKRMQTELRASRLTTIPRCGHVPQQECPKAFTRLLLQRLSEEPPRTFQASGQ